MLMAVVFVLFLALMIKLIFDLNKVLLSLPLEAFEKSHHPFTIVAQVLSRQDKTLLLILVLLLTAVWVYSVLDAFMVARKSGEGQS